MSSDHSTQPLAMLVDDVANFRDALSQLLELEGCRTVAFSDGRAALARLADPAAGLPDILFLDLRMPGLSGYQFLESFRAMPRCASIPVIILSFAVDPTEIERALQLGGTEHVDKTEVNRQRLREVLSRHVRIGPSSHP